MSSDNGPFQIDARRRLVVSVVEANESVALRANDSIGNAAVAAPRRLQIIRGEFSSERNGKTVRNAEADEDPRLAALEPPERSYDCSNYETCLGLAAALDWSSFTCAGCTGAVNQQLLWRAHHNLRNNPALTKLCDLPVLPKPTESD